VAAALARRSVKALVLGDRSAMVEQVAASVKLSGPRGIEVGAFVGDVTDEQFRRDVFDQTTARHGTASICVPAAGISRDSRAVKIDKMSGKAQIYPMENFRLVTEVNLIAPVYWALEMVA